jgi:hypothetical protein
MSVLVFEASFESWFAVPIPTDEEQKFSDERLEELASHINTKFQERNIQSAVMRNLDISDDIDNLEEEEEEVALPEPFTWNKEHVQILIDVSRKQKKGHIDLESSHFPLFYPSVEVSIVSLL